MKFKEKIKQQLIADAKEHLSKINSASQAAQEYKTSDDMKSEGKYDTRAIEAGYLAGAQEKRVEEQKLEVQMLEDLPTKELADSDSVAIGALVDLELNGSSQLYYISSTAGGKMLNIDGTVILVISVFSPIGSAALELKSGDHFELETPKEVREYKILSLQ